jgi:hypothetical protein
LLFEVYLKKVHKVVEEVEEYRAVDFVEVEAYTVAEVPVVEEHMVVEVVEVEEYITQEIVVEVGEYIILVVEDLMEMEM